MHQTSCQRVHFTNQDEVSKFLFLIHNQHKHVQDQLIKEMRTTTSLAECLQIAKRVEDTIQAERLAQQLQQGSVNSNGKTEVASIQRGHSKSKKGPKGKGYKYWSQSRSANLVQIFAIIAKCLICHINAQHLVKLVINATKKATTLNVVIQMPLQTLETPNLDLIGGYANLSVRLKCMTLIVRYMCMTRLSLNARSDLLINLQEITSCLMKLGIVKVNGES